VREGFDRMVEWLSSERWSPYIVGIGIGLLNCLAFVLSDKPIACSTSFARTSGMIERLLRGAKAVERLYYREFPPVVDWQFMLVLGVAIGAFVSSRLSGEFRLEWLPSTWASAFGSSAAARWLVAFIGGILMGLGARWAGGCTSGHGISGTLQLAVSSWLAAMCFFAGGIVMANLIFNIIGG
jgi:uncharacterized membrane protein YedE/YeeE